GKEPNWENLIAGHSGIGPISRFDASVLPARIAGEVRDFDAERYLERKDLKKMDLFIRYALGAAHMAIEDAGLPSPLPAPERAGGEALVLIRDGRQDMMLAGGAEAPVCLLGVGGFSAMRALATSFNEEPARASRPFDRRREGFVVAEGAGVLVLEELEHARRR